MGITKLPSTIENHKIRSPKGNLLFYPSLVLVYTFSLCQYANHFCDAMGKMKSMMYGHTSFKFDGGEHKSVHIDDRLIV